MSDKPTKEQLEEWKNSRHYHDDGTSMGGFGGQPEPETKDVQAPAATKDIKGPRRRK